jgi:phytoene dehydrogenase-like protein
VGSEPYDAIVIGAGVNGLVTASYLARSGRRTIVLERTDEPGGCAATEELWPGFRVDVGAHEMAALDRRAVADLHLDRAGLEIVRPDPAVVSLQPGGGALALYRDAARTADAIRPFSRRDAARWPAFADAMGRAARALGILYETTPPRAAGASRKDLWELVRLGAKLGRVGRADAVELMRLLPMTIGELLDEWFESDAVTGVLAARGCHGICQGPMAAGTALVFLHGMVGGSRLPLSTRWVRGGMAGLGAVLATAARDFGAKILTDATVGRITVRDHAVRGVVLESGEEIAGDLVASSADPRRTFLGLVDPGHLDPDFVRQVRNIRYRGACAKVHLALDGLPDFGSENGNAASFCVAPSLRYVERAYDDAKYGAPSREPHLRAVIPTVLDPTLAPQGRHVMSVLVQYAPYDLRDGEWDDGARDVVGDTALRTLAGCAPGLADRVVHSHVLSPADLEARFGLTEGSINHGEVMLDQVFIGRPVPGWARYETPIRGLYSCGAGSHPGGGLTGSPGVNAARRILAS